MKITLDIKKTVDENATVYFEKAKKARKKLVGVEATLEEFKKKQARQEEVDVNISSSIQKIEDTKQHWYEKFRWFLSSEGYLVIGGRDATSNEIVIKKHTDKEDIVFHTDMAGSPFIVIKKNEELPGVTKSELTSITLEEAASFTLIHSKAWKTGLSGSKVFWVTPEQVSKEANTGEYMQKGSFMIRGKTNYIDAPMNVAAGIVRVGDEQQFMIGPPSLFAKNSIAIIQGKEKTSAVAKQIRSLLIKSQDIDVSVDIIVRNLPQGCALKKIRKRKDEL